MSTTFRDGPAYPSRIVTSRSKKEKSPSLLYRVRGPYMGTDRDIPSCGSLVRRRPPPFHSSHQSPTIILRTDQDRATGGITRHVCLNQACHNPFAQESTVPHAPRMCGCVHPRGLGSVRTSALHSPWTSLVRYAFICAP